MDLKYVFMIIVNQDVLNVMELNYVSINDINLLVKNARVVLFALIIE
jgi:hypothetical protein